MQTYEELINSNDVYDVVEEILEGMRFNDIDYNYNIWTLEVVLEAYYCCDEAYFNDESKCTEYEKQDFLRLLEKEINHYNINEVI